MEKRNGLGKRNKGMIGVSMAVITVVVASLIVVIVLMNKGTSVKQDTEAQRNTEVQIGAVASDGWTEYIYVTKWQNESGKYYDTKEECLRNSVSGECKEKKVLDHAIWHEAE